MPLLVTLGSGAGHTTAGLSLWSIESFMSKSLWKAVNNTRQKRKAEMSSAVTSAVTSQVEGGFRKKLSTNPFTIKSFKK